LSDRPATASADKPLAIALAYERELDAAPRVVAKGQGAIAEAILRVAQENGVPIKEDAALASLLAAAELDREIPVEAYVAVAQVLSYIYQRRRPQSAAPASPT
jgi:flagellar biosynthesis protein